MKILITGGNGFLGQYLNLLLSKYHEILTLYHQEPRNCIQFNSQQIDIRDHANLTTLFNSFRPDIVIHTAAIASHQKALELPPKIVYETNVTSTKRIAELCDNLKCKLIYISTDLVYAGYRGSFLSEDAKLIPVSLYAETKLMGEEKIKSTFDNYVILRTALMFGLGLHGATCFFHQMYDKLKAGVKVKVFYNQYRSPISVLEAVRVIKFICELEIKNEVINVGGNERLSRYDLAARLCDIAGFDKNLLEKISIYDLPDLPHVEDVSLKIDRLKSLGFNPKTPEEALIEILRGETFISN